MDCSICLNNFHTNKFQTLHDAHQVCTECYENLRAHFHLSCPICRHPINQDLRSQVPVPNSHRRVISDNQLRAFNFPQEFIDSIRDRLPFFYTGRFEGVDFIHTARAEYDQWLETRNN
jgi:hypothetical protein